MVSTVVTVTKPIRGSLRVGDGLREHLLDGLVHPPHPPRSAHGSTAHAPYVRQPSGHRGARVRSHRARSLAREPPLGLVEQPGGVARLARHTRERQPCPLPHVVVVDLRDRAADAVRELLLHGTELHPLLLERMALREVELEREDADVARGHVRIPLAPAGRNGTRPTVVEIVRRFALLAALLACSVAGSGVRLGGRPADDVLNFGDSLGVGTGSTSATISRAGPSGTRRRSGLHAADVPGALRSLGAALPRVIVVSAGTNDDPGAISRFARTVRRASPSPGARAA